MEHEGVSTLTFQRIDNLRITSRTECYRTNCLSFATSKQRRAVSIVEYVNLASNLTYCATITTINTRLARKDTLTNDALLKRLKFVFDIVC